MLATAVEELLHVTVWPETVAPDASLAVAVNWTVAPMSSVWVAGDTVTDDTVGGGGSVGPSPPLQAAKRAARAATAGRFLFMVPGVGSVGTRPGSVP
ncbi:MAG: hypothetical protein AMXMBFR53_15960 [Gemmatimonadota bacterium]